MADEPVSDPRVQDDPERTRRTRGMLGLIGIVIVLVILALVLLMVRGCASSATRMDGESGIKEIVSVKGLNADPGQVSAWVKPGSDIFSILRIAGLEDAKITDMGGGRFVISVPAGTEDTVVRILAETDGVYDAGRVYKSGD
jgi:hypothetical protein